MSEEYDFYANNLNILASVYDITLNFSIRLPIKIDKEAGVVTETEDIHPVRIRMSPQHAKSLAALLVNHIKNYEKEHNVNLPVPDNMAQMWNQLVIQSNED